MKNKKYFNVGDRVVLISNRHGNGEANPVRGRRYECEGAVVDLDYSCSLPIRVKWDNERHNSYNTDDLECIFDNPFKDLQDFIEKELVI